MSDDLISRKEAISRIEALMPPLPNGDYQEGIDLGLIMAKTAVKEQPSAQQKAGHWEERETISKKLIRKWQSARCSACKRYHTTPYEYCYKYYNFCPNCGAKMEDNENE